MRTSYPDLQAEKKMKTDREGEERERREGERRDRERKRQREKRWQRPL